LADGYAAVTGFDYQGLAYTQDQSQPTRRYSYSTKDRRDRNEQFILYNEPDLGYYNDWDSPSYVTVNGVVLLRGKVNLLLGTIFFRLLGYSGQMVANLARWDQIRRSFQDDSGSAQAAIALGSAVYDAGLNSGLLTPSALRALQDPAHLNDANLWPLTSKYVPLAECSQDPRSTFVSCLRFQDQLFLPIVDAKTVACGPFAHTDAGLGVDPAACSKWGGR